MAVRDELLSALTAAMNAVRPERGALKAAGQLPAFVPAELQPFAIAVTDLAANGLRDQLASEPAIAPELATTLSRLALQLAKAGRSDDAALVSQEALALRRELAAAGGEDNLAGLAGSLINHAVRLAENGRPDEAVQVSQEALALCRGLASASRAAHLPNLALSLNNHAVRLADLGRRDEVVPVSEEALTLYRELATVNRAAHLPDLARSLDNHAVWLSQAGRRNEALPMSGEALSLRRELATVNRAAHLPDLANSLNNHAVRLAEAGWADESLPVSAEALALCRELASVNRAAHLPGLARSLDNHANRLAEAGRRDEALPVSKEALALCRELTTANRAAYLPGLARSLDNHANRLAEAGRRDEALAISKEALALRRELASQKPGSFLPDLARSLNNHAVRLARAGRRDEGLQVSAEALALRRELASLKPEAFLADLAGSLDNHAVWLAEAGRRDEAMPVSEEALGLRRELAAANPAAYLPDLAASLNNHANRLAEAGRRDEAMPVSEEAITLRRELAVASPAAHLPELAASLTNHVLRLAETGQRDGAEALFGEILGQFGASPLGSGYLLLARGRWRLSDGRLGDAVPDLATAVGVLADAGDNAAHGQVRLWLCRARQENREVFDQAWYQVQAQAPLPVWLRHSATDEKLGRAVQIWTEVTDWDSSKTHLQDNAAVLLTDAAEAALEHLIDSSPADDTLPCHLGLLRAARACGPDSAYAAHHERLLADRANAILKQWFACSTWELSAAFASAHHDDLLDPATGAMIAEIGDREPRNYLIRLHRGLQLYAGTAGFDAAYGLISDPGHLKAVLSATMGQSQKLAIARLQSGLSADDPEAHFQLAVTALLAGKLSESAAAAADCADHAAPYECTDFSRRLGCLTEDHPRLARDVGELRQILDSQARQEAG